MCFGNLLKAEAEGMLSFWLQGDMLMRRANIELPAFENGNGALAEKLLKIARVLGSLVFTNNLLPKLRFSAASR